MAFFDDIGKKITQTSQTAVKKTKDLADIAKINSRISAEEKSISTYYMQIGQKYYDYVSKNISSGEGVSISPELQEELVTLCSSISETVNNIKNMKEEISIIKNVKKCPNCGAECPNEMVFCSSCGYQLPVAEPVSYPAGSVFCSNCGQSLPSDAVFCTGCGTKVQ